MPPCCHRHLGSAVCLHSPRSVPSRGPASFDASRLSRPCFGCAVCALLLNVRVRICTVVPRPSLRARFRCRSVGDGSELRSFGNGGGGSVGGGVRGGSAAVHGVFLSIIGGRSRGKSRCVLAMEGVPPTLRDPVISHLSRLGLGRVRAVTQESAATTRHALTHARMYARMHARAQSLAHARTRVTRTALARTGETMVEHPSCTRACFTDAGVRDQVPAHLVNHRHFVQPGTPSSHARVGQQTLGRGTHGCVCAVPMVPAVELGSWSEGPALFGARERDD
eukprot:6174723-Pleurochrysis_carterae.AAC.2